MNADGSNVRQITHNTLWDEGPAWSPDGTKFVFSRGADDLAPRYLDDERRRLGRPATHHLSRSRRVARLGRQSRPRRGRRNGPGDAVAAARQRREPRHVPARRRAPTTPRSTTATITSTAGDATLSVLDTTGVSPGRLVNGAFALPQPLQVRANDGSYSTIPADLLRYGAPVSNDPVTIGFKQPIAATDALRTGNYAKTLTFTLSTTNP